MCAVLLACLHFLKWQEDIFTCFALAIQGTSSIPMYYLCGLVAVITTFRKTKYVMWCLFCLHNQQSDVTYVKSAAWMCASLRSGLRVCVAG